VSLYYYNSLEQNTCLQQQLNDNFLSFQQRCLKLANLDPDASPATPKTKNPAGLPQGT